MSNWIRCQEYRLDCERYRKQGARDWSYRIAFRAREKSSKKWRREFYRSPNEVNDNLPLIQKMLSIVGRIQPNKEFDIDYTPEDGIRGIRIPPSG